MGINQPFSKKDRTLTVYEFGIPKEKFLKASLQERIFFSQSLRIANEIIVLEKAILASLNGNKSLNLASHIISAQIIQSGHFIRLLAGILSESYKWIDLIFHAKGKIRKSFRFKFFGWNLKLWKDGSDLIKENNFTDLWPEYESLVSPEASSALKQIQEYFSRDNSIRKVRNKFGFHYDPEIAIQSEELLAIIDDPHILLEEAVGNSLYTFAGQLVVLQMIKTLGGDPQDETSFKKTWDSLLQDIHKYSNQMQKFYGGYIAAFSEKHLGLSLKDGKRHILENLKFLSELELPFFVKRDS